MNEQAEEMNEVLSNMRDCAVPRPTPAYGTCTCIAPDGIATLASDGKKFNVFYYSYKTMIDSVEKMYLSLNQAPPQKKKKDHGVKNYPV